MATKTEFSATEYISMHGDFKKYYDKTSKRNIWVLGYFGGGSINIMEAYELAKEYSKSTGVHLDTVQIDEILHSRRFKGFKFMFSNTPRVTEPDAEEMQDVFKWLHD